MMKKCTKCKEVKPFDSFNKSAREKDRLQYYCQSCQRESKLKWYADNSEINKQQSRGYRAANPEKVREGAKKWNQDHPEQRWMNVQEQRRRLFQPIPNGWFEKQLAIQSEVCAICCKKCTKHPRLSIDHDHKTGYVRGLLCNSCNRKVDTMSFHKELSPNEKNMLVERAKQYLKFPPACDNPLTIKEMSI